MSNKYTNLKCPCCGKKGQYETDKNLEVYCTRCGLIIQSQYPYTAGIRFDTLSYILLRKEIKKHAEKEEKIRMKRWRKYNDRIKKLQKI